MAVRRIISGGQTGADQAGLAAAAPLGIPTGGYMPKGWLTEDGPRPDLAERFGLQEAPIASYPDRTELNVLASNGTVVFGAMTDGSRLTRDLAKRHGKPCLVIAPGTPAAAAAMELSRWLASRRIQTLNVAGNRGSGAPELAGLPADR